MTAQGSPQARLRPAIATGNPTILGRRHSSCRGSSWWTRCRCACCFAIGIATAYERAAVRLHGRLCLELSSLGLADAQLALCALEGLRASEVDAAATALAGFCEHAWGSSEAADVVGAWLERRQP